VDPQPVPELIVAPTISRGAAVVSRGPRLFDDLAFAAEIGLQHVRLDAPWVDGQPRPGSVDGGVVEELRAAAAEARRLGLQPWFRLMQADVPKWFDDEGGFRDDKSAGKWWPRWVEAVSGELADVSAGWVPFEAPFAMARRLVPDDPRKHGELMHNLVVGWRDAWRILRGGPPVATSIDVATERPVGPTQADIDEARRRDRLRWGLWLDGLAHGIVSIPGRSARELADLAGSCDVLGLAVRTGVEAALHRAAEQGPERPLAITFRPIGTTDTECASSVAQMWRDVRAAAGSLTITAVTASPLLDAADRQGLATAERRVKDAGEAFLAG
jgi:beta-glucosidase